MSNTGVTFKLHAGKAQEVLRTLEAESVDLTVTSPPYDNLRTYDSSDVFDKQVWETVLSELFRVTKTGGSVVWIVNDATVDGSETGSSFRQALYAKEVGFKIHDTMIWRKPNFSNPSSTRYHQVFEYMFVFSKGTPVFNGIKDRENVYAGSVGSYGENTVTQPDGSKKVRPRKVVSAFGLRHNVWDKKTTGQTGEAKESGHPATFPVELARDHILSWSNPGDTVLDPFMGSGTTGEAALTCGRSFIGIEMNQDYFEWAKNRVSKVRSNG